MDEERECGTCEAYDIREGRCALKDEYHRVTDGEDCEDWRDWEVKALFGKGRRMKHYDD